MIDATEDKGILPEKYQEIVSEEDYDRLCIIPLYLYSDPKYVDKISKVDYSFDSANTKFYLGRAETTCEYSYYRYDKNSELTYEGHDANIIYYKFENGKWVVDDLYFYL
jgi:hypothetical protein